MERTLHILIEACIDAAQHIIAEKRWREPTSYRDAFQILSENGLIEAKDMESFHNMASFRNLLVHYYERVDNAVVYGIFKKNLSDFELFSDSVIRFLKQKDSGKNIRR